MSEQIYYKATGIKEKVIQEIIALAKKYQVEKVSTIRFAGKR